jgi:cytoskeletal protein CcmA (bactofilin family)
MAPTRFLGAALAAVAISPVLASVVTTDIFIVAPGESVGEDVYVAAQSGIVEGTIDGDLTMLSGDLTISGAVTGSVTALSAATVRVTETGTVGGSLRAVARQVIISGEVAGDVVSSAIVTKVEEQATVTRDLISFGARASIDGAVGRDVRGRVFDVAVAGRVGNDVDVTVSRLSIGGDAIVGGDVLYRSAGEAVIGEGATITGQVIALPSSPNFIYGVILTLANIVSLLAFVVIGFVVIWLFRGTSARAAAAAVHRPLRSLLTGLLAVVLAPVLVVLFAVTLVGIPLALALAVLIVLGLVVGPVPVVTAAGDRILRSRGGLFAAFLLGGVLWRLGIWFIPWIGGFLFLIGLVWGVGAWLVAAWVQRAAGGGDIDLLPPAMRLEEDLPDDWDFPLPPVPPPPSVPTGGPRDEGPRDEGPRDEGPRDEGPRDEGRRDDATPASDLPGRIAAITASESLPQPAETVPAHADPGGGEQPSGGDREQAGDDGDDWGLPRR